MVPATVKHPIGILAGLFNGTALVALHISKIRCEFGDTVAPMLTRQVLSVRTTVPGTLFGRPLQSVPPAPVAGGNRRKRQPHFTEKNIFGGRGGVRTRGPLLAKQGLGQVVRLRPPGLKCTNQDFACPQRRTNSMRVYLGTRIEPAVSTSTFTTRFTFRRKLLGFLIPHAM